MALKELTDNELIKLADDFVRLNLKDRDNTVFDFEADVERMIKNINLNKLIANNKKYLKSVRNFIMQIFLKFYLKDVINIGIKKMNRYRKFYLEPANAS